MGKKFIFLFMIVSMLACQQVTTGFTETERNPAGNNNQGNPGDQNAINQALTDALNNAEDSPPVVEIRHLVEPKVDNETEGGAYLKKLTIPRDYKGKLYLAGINLSTLNGKNVKVRFRFGVGGASEHVIPASLGTAPGLIDNSSVSVLVMDLRDRPFYNMNLLYDLYDYNDYTFDGSSDQSALSEAVNYNRDTKLYCRGLSLQDDPTFTGDIANGCTGANDICKYAYASVEDQGLTFTGTLGEVALVPDRGHIESGTSGYYADTDTEKLRRCLPDNPPAQLAANGALFTFDNINQFGLVLPITINGTAYTYKGPYRVTATENWEIVPDSDASRNRYGLFSSPVTPGLEYYMYGAKLFPRYVKKSLSSGVEYLGSNNPTDAKTLQAMAGSGESLWMDGCVERVTTRVNGEHIGSCNVTGTIEVFYEEDGIENQVDITNDVKLQIVKENNFPEDPTNVVSPSFQACSSTSQCGTSECCINNRCWDKSIVSSCVEDEPTYGNAVTGASCNTDYECASLCCQGGTCQIHDEDNQNYCQKPVGQSCVAKDWCQKQPVTRCFIVKTGIDPQGGQQCALRCYTNLESGECLNGTCRAPTQPDPPVFDPNDPNRCDTACDPPDFQDGVFSINCGDGN